MQQIRNNKILVIIFICTVIFFVFVLPNINCDEDKEPLTNTTKTEQFKLSEKRCSPSCCNYTQWKPLDPALEMYAYDPESPYVPSNYTCSQGASSGCPCLKKKDYKYLTNKGGNGGNCS
jgi:hypothetical protein